MFGFTTKRRVSESTRHKMSVAARCGPQPKKIKLKMPKGLKKR